MESLLSSTPEADAQPSADVVFSDDLIDDLASITDDQHAGIGIERRDPASLTIPSSPLPRSTSYTNRVVLDIASDPHAAEPSYFIRPNRYFGPPSTWKSWTATERVVSNSLNVLRNQNLSIHLFNAFALKRKAVFQRHSVNKRRKGKARAEATRSTSPEEESVNSNLSFAPPDLWTSWPLPPEEVPRDTFQPCTDVDAFRPAPDLRPSAALEECLIATITRLARERWEAREWEVDFPKRDMKVEHEDKDKEKAAAPNSPVDTREDASDTESGESISDTPYDHSGVQMFSSQAVDFDLDDTDTEGDSEPSTDKSEILPRPVPISDDTRARQLLLPSTRHIISKLDDLLLGLHKARQAYAKPRPQRLRRRRSSSALKDTDYTTTVEELTPSASSRKRKRKASELYQPKPRDWSDVLGMASLTGWKQSIVNRAAERCALLFNENMLFRTFHSGNLSNPAPTRNQQQKTPSYYTEHFATSLSPSPSTSPAPDDPTSSIPSENRPTLIRTSPPCQSCQDQNTRCLPSPSNPKTCNNCELNCLSCSGIQTLTIAQGRNTRFCPHQTCERHSIPFKTTYTLQRHIDNVHNTSSPYPTMNNTHAQSTLQHSSEMEYTTTDYDTDFPASGEIIVCPVKGCKRNKPENGFNRGANLYGHLRRVHPDVDVDEVKKVERDRRGERRGRWRDERRRRSVSRDVSRKGWDTRRKRMGGDIEREVESGGGEGGMGGRQEQVEENEEGEEEVENDSR